MIRRPPRSTLLPYASLFRSGLVARPLKDPAGRVDVLGVGVDPLTVGDLHAEIGRLVRSRECCLVLNVNAYCLNLCYEDPKLRGFLNAAHVVFCDGVGVMLAARILGRRIPERITYADWAWQLAALAAAQGLSLYLLGARPGVAQEAARRLRESYPALQIAGVRHGYFDHSAGSLENQAVVEEINARAPDIDRKSTRLNSSHANISYAAFCLKKNKHQRTVIPLSPLLG